MKQEVNARPEMYSDEEGDAGVEARALAELREERRVRGLGRGG